MLKNDVIELLGGVRQTAAFLGITRQAVHNWPDVIPELRQYHLRDKRPNIDAELAKLRDRQSA